MRKCVFRAAAPWGTHMRATLNMPTLQDAKDRLIADDPVWKHIYSMADCATNEPETAYGEINFEVIQ